MADEKVDEKDIPTSVVRIRRKPRSAEDVAKLSVGRVSPQPQSINVRGKEEVRVEAAAAKEAAIKKVYGLLALEKRAWSDYKNPAIQGFIDALRGRELFGGSLSKSLEALEKQLVRHNELVRSISEGYGSRFIGKASGRKSLATSRKRAGYTNESTKGKPGWHGFVGRNYSTEERVELPKSWGSSGREFVLLEKRIDKVIAEIQLEVKHTDEELKEMLENSERFTSDSERLAALAGRVEVPGKSIEVLQSLAERNYDHIKRVVKLYRQVSLKYSAFRKIFLRELELVEADWKLAQSNRNRQVNLRVVKQLEEKVRVEINGLINNTEALSNESQTFKRDVRELRQITRALLMRRRNWFGRSWQRLRLAFG